MRTLKWVLRAQEPLCPEEILEATALDPFDMTFDKDRMALSVGYLIHVCGNFIALDVQTNRLRFVHYSVQEFLGRNEEFHSAEDLVVEVCLTVLGHSDPGSVAVRRDRYQGQVGSGRYLYEYAARHWVTHCKSWDTIDDRRGKLIEQFLLNPQFLSNWVNGRFVPQLPCEVTSYYNLPVILQRLLQVDMYSVESKARALVTAVGRGYREVVEVLLENGTDPNRSSSAINNDQYYDISSQNTWLGLEVAARVGHVEILKLLLNAGANVNAKDGIALRQAVEHENGEIVELVLNSGADANAMDGIALRCMVTRGNEKIVELLLNYGANASANDGTALRQATKHGHEKIVELLLNAGANANADDGILFRLATRSGNQTIVGLLLNAARDPHVQGPYALTAAAFYGNIEVVRHLVDAGVDVNAEDGSALRAAARGGNEEIVEQLLTAGADATAEDGSAIRAAAWAGHWKIVELLRNASTGIYSGAQSAIQDVVWRSRLNAVQLLGNAQDESTARAAVELPAPAWIPRIGGSVEGKSIVLAAAVDRSMDLVQPLLDTGADANDAGGYGFRAEGWAGHQRSVDMLLNARPGGNYEGLSDAREAAWLYRLQVFEQQHNAVILANSHDAPTQEPVELPAPTWIPRMRGDMVDGSVL